MRCTRGTRRWMTSSAVTGKTIPLDTLRYWSVERQEAYADAEASLAAERR